MTYCSTPTKKKVDTCLLASKVRLTLASVQQIAEITCTGVSAGAAEVVAAAEVFLMLPIL